MGRALLDRLGGVGRLAGRTLGRPSVVGWLALGWALAMLVRAHLLFIRRPHAVNVDEAYIVALGQRMLDGSWLPYVDGVSHRGPVAYWVGAVIALFGSDTFVPMRIAALLAFLATAAFTFLAARAAGHALAGAVGAIALVMGSLLVVHARDGIAFNGEPLLNVFVMAAFLCLVKGLRRGERPIDVRWLAAAGALIMLGALSKQVGALTFFGFAPWVLAAALNQRQLSRLQRWRPLVFYAGGAVAPLAVVLARYALSGELRTFWYWFYTFNVDVYMLPLRHVARGKALWTWFNENLIPMTLASVALTWTLGRWVAASLRARSLWLGYQAVGFPMTVALTAVTSLLGAHMGLRGFGHYFVQAMPWLGMLAGLLLEPLDRRSRDGGRHGNGDQHRRDERDLRPDSSLSLAIHSLLVLTPLVLVTEKAWTPRGDGYRQSLAGVKPPAICALVKEHARADQPIFVWGFRPDLYVSCQRKAATRFVYTTVVAGLVPWFNDRSKQQDDELATPGSRDQLIADLESSRAPVIVDAYVSLANRSMRRYDKLAAYLDTHYRWLTRMDGADIYLRGKQNRRALFDFEEPALDPDWVLEGAAFRAPAAAPTTLPTPINGQVGARLINTFEPHGDRPQGSAVSPPFVIDRTLLGFLIGGGKSCRVQLRIEGETVYEQRGYDTPQLYDVVWDVSAHRGKRAQLVLLDEASGSWGHLRLDRVELFDPE
jgi:4-amino-4-deoxy-L-arabinose transferase-like glycosyltransferase